MINKPDNLKDAAGTVHACTPETCPEPSTYYVTAIDGDRWWKMAGPYANHTAALADVDRARTLTDKHDRSGRAWFMGWGTARVESTELGNLNKAGLMEAA